MSVKIAVIDTGVNFELLNGNIEISDYVSLEIKRYNGETYIHISEGISYENTKASTHGTDVINTISKYSGDTKIQIQLYDIFGGTEKSSGILIIEALNMIMNRDVEMIVMSLTCDSEYESEFMKFRNSILAKNIIFLSSMSNDGKQNCPSYLDFVYGVGGQGYTENGKYSYNPERRYQFWSNTQYEFVGPLDDLQLFDGTSKATAVIAGILAKFIDKKGKVALQEYLKTPYSNLVLEKSEVPNDLQCNRKLLVRVLSAFGLEISDITDELLVALIPWNTRNRKSLIYLFESLGCLERLLDLNYCEFKSIYKIVKALEKIICK